VPEIESIKKPNGMLDDLEDIKVTSGNYACSDFKNNDQQRNTISQFDV
jgi:hypothetical protein